MFRFASVYSDILYIFKFKIKYITSVTNVGFGFTSRCLQTERFYCKLRELLVSMPELIMMSFVKKIQINRGQPLADEFENSNYKTCNSFFAFLFIHRIISQSPFIWSYETFEEICLIKMKLKREVNKRTVLQVDDHHWWALVTITQVLF